jgi:hypothetical protein
MNLPLLDLLSFRVHLLLRSKRFGGTAISYSYKIICKDGKELQFPIKSLIKLRFGDCELDIIIFATAVRGTDKNIPTTPQIYPHKRSERRITIGFNPKRSPNIFGSKPLPIIV